MQSVKQCVLGLFLALLSFSLIAHPHSFIVMKTLLVGANSQFIGLKIRWTMEEIISAALLYDACNGKTGEELRKNLTADVV